MKRLIAFMLAFMIWMLVAVPAFAGCVYHNSSGNAYACKHESRHAADGNHSTSSGVCQREKDYSYCNAYCAYKIPNASRICGCQVSSMTRSHKHKEYHEICSDKLIPCAY